MSKKVLTIQDISCVGQCSLTVALPVISAMGMETCVLPSAVLSTHTSGFKDYTYKDLTEDLPSICAHWQKENIKFDIFYTGYIGNKKQFQYIEDIFNKCGKENRIIIIDPVMADHGVLYKGFDENYVKGMAKLCKNADIIIPNITEACFLTETKYKNGIHSEEYIISLIEKLSHLQARHIVLTGICFEKEMLGVAVCDTQKNDVKYYFNERVPKDFHGTGDTYASSFTGSVALGKSIYESAALAADFTVEAIKQTICDADHWYGVKFEKAIPYLIDRLK